MAASCLALKVTQFLIQIAFDLQLFPTNAVRLIPMKLDVMNCTIGEQNHRKTFTFAPSSHSIDLAQTSDLPESDCQPQWFRRLASPAHLTQIIPQTIRIASVIDWAL